MANTFEPWTVSIAAALFAYDLQAIISINQIGVGVWGWSLKGTAIGLYFFRKRELIHEETSSSNGKVKKSVKHRQFNSPTKNLPPFSIISGMVFGLIGLLIAMPPLQADISFRKSYFSGSLPSMFNATGKLGTTAWHLGLVQEVAARANEGDFAIKMNGRLTQKFPREFYGWQWRVASPLLSDSQRTSSYKVLRTLDPNFFCFEQDSGNRVKQIIMRLSMPEQVELARSWGLIDGNKAAGDSFSLNSNFPNQLEEKSIGYCR
jgi:hypothetical protein